MRIRTIKPEFFLHEGLCTLEESTGLPVRLAFIGLWCVADREGRFRWEPRKLGVQILPYDSRDFLYVLEALHGAGFLVRYGPSGEFGFIPSFLKHQCINVREAKSLIPECENPAHEFHVHARALPVHARGEGKGMERKGMEGEEAADAPFDLVFEEPPPKPKPKGKASSLEEVEEYALSQNAPKSAALDFWDMMEASGWTRSKAPLKDWQAHFRVYWRNNWIGKSTTHQAASSVPGLHVKKGQC